MKLTVMIGALLVALLVLVICAPKFLQGNSQADSSDVLDSSEDQAASSDVTDNSENVDDSGVSDPPSSDGAAGDRMVTYTKDFGTYQLPADWEEVPADTGHGKVFYLKKGTKYEKEPDNISVNVGTNRYSLEDHGSFGRAIQQQLIMQLAGSHSLLTGGGFETAGGNIVYLFTIKEDERALVTNQYYIVGEKRYCLVHESNFDNSEECDKVAKELLASFVWKE